MVIPDGVTEISDRAFLRCESLREVMFEAGSELKMIGKSAFEFCKNLAKINLPEGVKSLGDYAFCLCESLKNIQLPNGLEKIGAGCF